MNNNTTKETDTQISFSPEVNEVISKYTTSIPVDVKKVARDHGIKLNAIFMERDAGRIRKSKNEYIIDYNLYHPEVKQRFTIAHELGHFFLHKGEINKQGLTDNALYFSGLSTELEVEANKFAAELLMPYQAIYPVIHYATKAGKDLAPRDLAKLLEVSEQAIMTRLGIPA